jgi:hypothetical protein
VAKDIDEVLMAKWLITIGIACVALGLLWPWLSKLGLGRLPGDIAVKKEGFSFFFLITTSIIISIVVSVLIWIFRR